MLKTEQKSSSITLTTSNLLNDIRLGLASSSSHSKTMFLRFSSNEIEMLCPNYISSVLELKTD